VPPSRPKDKKRAKRRRLLEKKAPKSARRQVLKMRKTPTGASVKRAADKPLGKLFEDLVAVQARLRAPGGCPWDREQTHLTLRTYLIEEAYEVLDAIEKGSPLELAEELGDLLLQVLFHADLASEAGAFDISNVIIGIHNKMIRRHPHVFGNVKAETPADVLKNWAVLKAQEKLASGKEGAGPRKHVPSVVEGVSRNLPALVEAYQLTRRAAQIGFDWEDVKGICEKLDEEVTELLVAIESSDSRAIEEEVGDVLFSVVNLARFLRFDPEVTLKRSNLKFKERFREMEREASRLNLQLSELSKEQLEELWVAAKSKLHTQISPEPSS
jgi:MazG family protein